MLRTVHIFLEQAIINYCFLLLFPSHVFFSKTRLLLYAWESEWLPHFAEGLLASAEASRHQTL